MRTNTEQKRQSKERGQTLIMFVLFMFMLILFVGLGIDLGFAYITRARLSKAVDAACLMGIRNVSLGNAKAELIADSAFHANYGTSTRDVGPVTPVVHVGSLHNNITIDVGATTEINTFFISVLHALFPAGPSWQTLTVGSTAQAMRPNLILSLVLDRSGSMNDNQGAEKLPPAVENFIDFFDDQLDRAGMASFASDARTNGSSYYVKMRQPFKTAIKNAANAMPFEGATFSPGGLTNALVQFQELTVVTPNEKVVKVCVFFTDGYANTVQDRLNCPPATLINFGGNAPSERESIAFMNPSDGSVLCWETDSTGHTPVTPSCCSHASTFRSIDGTMKTFTRTHIAADSEDRSVELADEMRANGIIVYSIGLGNDINQTFLTEVANDPTLLGRVPTGYDGEAVFAPTSEQLKSVFEVVANKILVRLTR